MGGMRWQLFHCWKQSGGRCFDYLTGSVGGGKCILQKKYGQKQGICLIGLLESPNNMKDMLHYKRIPRATSLFRLQVTLL